MAREKAAGGGSSKRVTARESVKNPRSPWRHAGQWQKRKLFIGAERRHGSRRSLRSCYLMPVPRPLVFREAPSGVGATRTAGWALKLGVGGGGSERRRGWEELLPEHSFGPCCALSQVRDGVVCRPRKGRASAAACSPILPRRKWRARETDIRGVWGTLTSRAPITLYPVSFPLLPHPNSPFKRYCPPGLLAPFLFVMEGRQSG